MMGRHGLKGLVVLGCVTLLISLAASSCSSSPSSGPVSSVGSYGVRKVTQSFVDSSRNTPATPQSAAHHGRTLVTTIYYPASSAQSPYPLIVFAHGFGSSPSAYAVLLRDWASAGYVVAAPRFPLTSSTSPGGGDLGDFANQPADMSFVISAVSRESASGRGVLGGLVDRSEIGAAGHSLGGVTTLGLVGNSCCRDPRVRAAVAMSGDAISFPTGRVRYSSSVALLLVHGNADPTVPYVSSVDVFNQAPAPKGLLTIVGGDHGSPVDPSDPWFSNVVRATTDFFDLYLKGEERAKPRLESDARSSRTRLDFVSSRGTHVTLPTPPTVASSLHATVSPQNSLTDGETLTVTWDGYVPGKSVNILECSKSPPTGPGDCDLTDAKLLLPDPEGQGSQQVVVHTGAIGSGACDAQHPGCVVVVNEGGSSTPSSSAIVPISFANPA
ncbi:MAG: neocarzinostatin apoprotein domain-containing protein [Acidimicrobiales bacterium]